MLVDLVKTAGVGDGPFDRPDDPRSLAGVQTVDALTARFSRDAVAFGQTGAALGAAQRDAELTVHDRLGRVANSRVSFRQCLLTRTSISCREFI